MSKESLKFEALAIKNAKDLAVSDEAKKRKPLHEIKIKAKIMTLEGKIMEQQSEVDTCQENVYNAVGSLDHTTTDDWLMNIGNYENKLSIAAGKLEQLEETKSYLTELLERHF